MKMHFLYRAHRSCLSRPDYNDAAFLTWIKESLAGKEPHMQTVGGVNGQLHSADPPNGRKNKGLGHE